jgi:transcriptional regulator with XRE-family HTH domain
MGRRESAVVATTRQSEALALWLRSQRERRGVTYATMAKLTNHRFSPSMLSRGANGKVPSRRLVLAYTKACDADAGEAMRLWKAERRAEEERRRRAGFPEFGELATSVRSVMVHPDVIGTFGQLRDAMVELRAREGQPSLGDMQEAAERTPDGRRHRLPKSSLSVILRGEAVPSRAHLTAFMEALHAPAPSDRAWERAWDRADSLDRNPPVAVKIAVKEVPQTGQPDGHPVPAAVSSEELTFLQAQLVVGPAGPDACRGPQFANPAVAFTRAGLPRRRPHHYECFAFRQPYEPQFNFRVRGVSPLPVPSTRLMPIRPLPIRPRPFPPAPGPSLPRPAVNAPRPAVNVSQPACPGWSNAGGSRENHVSPAGRTTDRRCAEHLETSAISECVCRPPTSRPHGAACGSGWIAAPIAEGLDASNECSTGSRETSTTSNPAHAVVGMSKETGTAPAAILCRVRP